MTLLEKTIKDKGLKKIWIAEKIGIDTRTLNCWIKYDSLSQVEKFTNLLMLLDLPATDVLAEMLYEIENEKEKKKKKDKK